MKPGRWRPGRGTPPAGTVSRTGARCLACGDITDLSHVRAEGRAGRMGAQLMAIVAEGQLDQAWLSGRPDIPDQSSPAT